MGPHHAEVFSKIMSDYDTESIGPFIVTSNKVELPKSPLNFEEKKQVMMAHGIPGDRIIQVSNPYYAKEVLFDYDPSEVEAIYLVGEKDMAEDPRFSKTEGVTKEGYKWSVEVAPHVTKDVEGEEMSGTSLRATLANANEETFYSIMGFEDKKIYDLLTQKFSQVKEDFYDSKYYDFAKTNDPNPKKPVESNYKYNRRNFPFRSMYESRGGEEEMHIYDFDETIARALTPIPFTVSTPEGGFLEAGETTSKDFESKKEELEGSYDEGSVNIEFNFSEFDKIIGDAILNEPVWNDLLTSMKNPNVTTTILTARSIGKPVTDYLKRMMGEDEEAQGLETPYVVALGLEKQGAQVTGEDKANWIKKRIKNTTKKVIFTDDASENTEAVKKLKIEFPDIAFEIEKPPPIETIDEMMGTMNKQEMRKHKKVLKTIKKDLKRYEKENRYYEVPQNWRGSLTRKIKLNETAAARIEGHSIPLEIMDTPDLQVTGMMGRKKLEGGMAFPYDEVAKREFHTKNCKIPLDIIFINQGEIDSISHNCPPCQEKNCPKYSGMADTVLELLGGYCEQNNINVGDKVALNLTKPPKPVFMSESRLFSKEWWKNIINETLLTEGGAAGHMAHPFNLPDVNSGSDLKDIFNKAADSLKVGPGSVKIDGVNSSIRLVDLDGTKQFVMDRGSKMALDVKGITKDDLETRFKPGHGMIEIGGAVLDMFNEALPSIKGDLEKLGAWDNPNILFNMEYVSGQTNVQKYDNNFIAIHGLNQIELDRTEVGQRESKEISYDKSAFQSLLDNLAPIAKEKGFEMHGSVPTEMTKDPNFSSALSTNYTIVSNEGEKTQTLDQWLNELNNIPEKDFIFINVDNSKKKIGAVSKLVYTTLLNGGNIDELFENEEDKQKAIEGFTTYLATEKLGDEVLKVLNSPMGSVENHEGVVIRDENIANVPFKITGKFILGGMTSDF